jgi:hypothetical protein
MYNILVIGMTGQGKSPFIQKYIEGRNCFVFDVQNEYGERPKYPGGRVFNLSNNLNAPRARQIDFNVSGFLQNCLKKKNTVCVFEEATIFFKGNTSELTRRVMISRLFTNNVSVFVFHSIRNVPPDIMSLINIVVLFKTGDQYGEVKYKYPSLYPYYMRLKKAPKGSKFIIKTIE